MPKASYSFRNRMRMHWKCKDGTVMPVCLMTINHLQNTMAMLERKAKRSACECADFMEWSCRCVGPVPLADTVHAVMADVLAYKIAQQGEHAGTQKDL